MRLRNLLKIGIITLLVIYPMQHVPVTSKKPYNFDSGGPRPCAGVSFPRCPPGFDKKSDHSYFASSFSISESVAIDHTLAV
jgi:hypothetical protein